MVGACKGKAGRRRKERSVGGSWLFVALAVCGVAHYGCAGARDESPAMDGPQAGSPPIERVLERVTEGWLKVPGVVGTGLGLCDGTPCIKVFVTRPPEALEPPIPEEVEGHPVRFEPSGPFRALDTIPGRG